MNAGKLVAGIAAAAVAAEGIFSFAQGKSTLLRPPGSQGEGDFAARCIKCGKCVEACPHAVIHLAGALDGAAAGTPYIDARTMACRLCEDFPCVGACPTGALRDVSQRCDVNMGYAKIDENLCIAFRGMRCEVCYRVCPYIDKAIKLDFQTLAGDSIHAKFIPQIDTAVCVGCGLCVERCVVSEPRVAIRIVTLGEQERNGKVVEKTGAGKGNGSGNGSGSGNGMGNGSGSGSKNG